MVYGIRTHDPTRLSLKSKIKFSAQWSRQTRDFEKKISIHNIAGIALIPKLLEFSVPRPQSLGIDVKYFLRAILKIGVDVCPPHT